MTIKIPIQRLLKYELWRIDDTIMNTNILIFRISASTPHRFSIEVLHAIFVAHTYGLAGHAGDLQVVGVDEEAFIGG